MKQLQKTERQEIYLLREKGYSLRGIAKALGRDVSTVSREVRRNAVKGLYFPEKAQQKFALRWKYRKPYMKKIRQNDELETYIRAKLREGWSPEQIAGRWNRAGKEQISFMSIYSYLDAFGNGLKRYLYFRGRKKKKKGSTPKVLIPHRIWIDDRPPVVDKRERFGDYEGDTIVSRRGDKTSLLTILERKSRYLFASKVPNKKSDQVRKKISQMMKKLAVQTMTFDNGVEFAYHYKLSWQTYFCHPYSSWEKGQVEYANRLLRRFFPKKSILKDISHAQLKKTVERINATPRKCLKYQTPQEIFLAHLQNSP